MEEWRELQGPSQQANYLKQLLQGPAALKALQQVQAGRAASESAAGALGRSLQGSCASSASILREASSLTAGSNASESSNVNRLATPLLAPCQSPDDLSPVTGSHLQLLALKHKQL